MSAGDDARREHIARLVQQLHDYDDICASADADIEQARNLEMEALLLRDRAETEKANAVKKRERVAAEVDRNLDLLPREAS